MSPHSTADLLQHTRELRYRLEILKALLSLQQRQFADWDARLCGSRPADTAARRLIDLKRVRT